MKIKSGFVFLSPEGEADSQPCWWWCWPSLYFQFGFSGNSGNLTEKAQNESTRTIKCWCWFTWNYGSHLRCAPRREVAKTGTDLWWTRHSVAPWSLATQTRWWVYLGAPQENKLYLLNIRGSKKVNLLSKATVNKASRFKLVLMSFRFQIKNWIQSAAS